MAAQQQPSFEGQPQPPSPARITEIDISAPARALAVLRGSDYTLVVVCGLTVLGLLTELVTAAANGRWAEVFGEAAVAAAMVFAAFTGWRHVGVIDPRVWRSYLWVFPVLGTTSILATLAIVADWIAKRANPLDDVQAFVGLFAWLWFAGVAIPGFVCVMLLRRMRIEPMGIRLDALLTGLIKRGGISAPSVTRVERPGLRRGLVYGALGAVVLLATTFAPVPADSKYASTYYRVTWQVNSIAFFLIVRARRHFQVSADSLLAVDKRPPILFLRSFADDEREQYGNAQRALLDFSLETRLANHFHRFGPFIAVGSPKDTVPQPGAARVLLADDEWQSRVLGWMKSSSLIVMYCGTTEWVNWELRKVVESGRSTSLILMIPEIRGWRSSKRQRDIAARVTQLRDVFRQTPWNEELMEFSDFPGLRAMLFRADGSMVMVRSRSRSRDSYHLAALIAHQQLLEPMPDARQAAPAAVVRAQHRFWKVAGALAAAAAIVAGVYLVGSNQSSRLTFQKGELYYVKPVAQAEAQSVGEYLVRQQYFSGNKAVSVRLDQKNGRYQLQFVIDPAYANDLLSLIHWGWMGSEISREALGGKPLDVWVADSELKPIRAVPASAKLMFGKGELYYTDPVTAGEANQVRGQLLQLFGSENALSAHLGRDQNAYQLRFVIDPSRADQPGVLAAFSELTRGISAQALGGQPVMMYLCDDHWRALKSERVDSPTKTQLAAQSEERQRRKTERMELENLRRKQEQEQWAARQREMQLQQEQEALRRQQLEAQRQALEQLKAEQEEQQRQLEDARRKLAEEQAQRERAEQARYEAAAVQAVPPAAVSSPKLARASYSGPGFGDIVWEGTVKGAELITIENGQASSGTVTGSLPGVPCLIQPTDPRKVSIASAPAPRNQYNRLVIRVSGNGRTRVTVKWSLP